MVLLAVEWRRVHKGLQASAVSLLAFPGSLTRGDIAWNGSHIFKRCISCHSPIDRLGAMFADAPLGLPERMQALR
jgi:cytochrome c2